MSELVAPLVRGYEGSLLAGTVPCRHRRDAEVHAAEANNALSQLVQTHAQEEQARPCMDARGLLLGLLQESIAPLRPVLELVVEVGPVVPLGAGPLVRVYVQSDPGDLDVRGLESVQALPGGGGGVAAEVHVQLLHAEVNGCLHYESGRDPLLAQLVRLYVLVLVYECGLQVHHAGG